MKNKSRILDQFYTNKSTAKKCMDLIRKTIKKSEKFFFIEPSAGEWVFLYQLNNEHSLWLDIDPKRKDIIKQDFLYFDISKYENNIKWKKIISFWNPPFWKNSSLAIKFFNISAKYSEYICFILPKTFNKDSVTNKLDLNFHKITDLCIDENSFIHNWKEYNVPCIFQIWKRKDMKRKKIIKKTTHDDFEFVKKSENPDVAIRRVWVKAWTLYKDINKYAEASHYYLKVKKENNFFEKYKKICFNKYIYNTAWNPSLSKWELVEAYEKFNQ